MRNHRQRIRRIREIDYSQTDKQSRCQNTLEQKSDAGPAVREVGKQSLQDFLRSERTVRKSRLKRNPSQLGRGVLLLGEAQFDNSTLETDRHGMSAVIGTEFRKYVRNVTLDGSLADGKLIGN